MNDTTPKRGGAGRGQGRKRLSERGTKPYKLLLTDEQREKLDKLGGPPWVRGKIDAEPYPDGEADEGALGKAAGGAAK